MPPTITTCKICGSSATPLYSSLQDRIGQAAGTWNLLRCADSRCGLVSIEPMPDAATLAKAYETYYTHKPTICVSGLRRLYLRARDSYLRSRFGYPAKMEPPWVRIAGHLLAWLPHRRVAMESLALWLPWQPGGRLLEIGCGNGERLALLRDLGWKVAGIEPDPKAAQLAITKGIDICPETLQAGAYPPGSFDAVVMSHVIEHVPDPVQILRESQRLLRPGGLLTMLTPNGDSLGHRWFGKDWLHLDPPRHLYLFNSRNLSKLCADVGFVKVCCATTSRDANWTLGASLVLQRQHRYAIGQLPFLLKFLGLCLYYAEWAVLFFQPEFGEELFVTARKANS